MLNTDKIYFYPYKIFEVERRKYLYTIYASGLFEIDNTVSKLLQLNGSMIIPELSEPPVRTLGATIPENESHIFR